MTHTCTKCKATKPLNVTEFYRIDGTKNGFMNICIECKKAYTKKRYYLKKSKK